VHNALIELLESETCNGGQGCTHVDAIKEMLKMSEQENDDRVWFIPSAEDWDRGCKPTPYEDLEFVCGDDVPEGEVHLTDKSGRIVGKLTNIGGKVEKHAESEHSN